MTVQRDAPRGLDGHTLACSTHQGTCCDCGAVPARCPTCGGEKFFPKILPHPTEDAYCFDKWHSDPPAEPQEAREQWEMPDGFAHRYPDGIRFGSYGQTINGSNPTETLPFYFKDTVRNIVAAETASLRQRVEDAERRIETLTAINDNLFMEHNALQLAERECGVLKEALRKAKSLISKAHEAIAESAWEAKLPPTQWMLEAEKFCSDYPEAESALRSEEKE